MQSLGLNLGAIAMLIASIVTVCVSILVIVTEASHLNFMNGIERILTEAYKTDIVQQLDDYINYCGVIRMEIISEKIGNGLSLMDAVLLVQGFYDDEQNTKLVELVRLMTVIHGTFITWFDKVQNLNALKMSGKLQEYNDSVASQTELVQNIN
jgi:hypothetical protein